MFKNLLSRIKNKKKISETQIEYETLLPKDDIDNNTEFMIDYAIKKNNVNNIAITGGYSTGKSSVINTYFKEKDNVVNISLATFEEKNEEQNILDNIPNENDTSNEEKKKTQNIICNTSSKDKTKQNAITQEVEKTIIEKLYYFSYNKENIRTILKNIICTIILTYMIFLITINIIGKILSHFNLIERIIICASYLLFLSIILYFFSRKISEITKIKLKVGEIEVDANIDERNILNENIDKIIKIIKDINYKYIIFEDLDRFECPKIYEHLRDLNITINSTLNKEKQVKFIYAVRDDMFSDENRTKFFDMIIPVVPYVSYTNSGVELSKIIKKYNLENELSDDFIKDICLFVSDIRILKNTLNEYVVYKKKVEPKNLNEKTSFYKNLFSIMLYKNTCSKDFELLVKRNKNGIIYNLFLNIIKYKENEIEKIDKRIEEYKEEEKTLENSMIIDKEHLISALISEIKEKDEYALQLKTEDIGPIAISYGMDREIFEEDILDENFEINIYRNGTYKWQKMSTYLLEKFQDLYNKFKILKNKEENRKEQIQSEIYNAEAKKRQVNELNLKEIIEEYNTNILDNIKLGKYSQLIRYLVSEGYINEAYEEYIVEFHEGDKIKTNDRTYLMSLKAREILPFNAKIDNPKDVFKQLKEEVSKEYSLNKYILDEILNNEYIHDIRRMSYIYTFKRNKDYINMFKECIYDKNFKNKSELLKEVFTKDENIWSEIDEEIQNEEEKINLLKKIIENIDIKIITKHKERELIEIFINNNDIAISNFDIMKNMLDNLNIEYIKLSEIKENKEIIDYIIKNNKYRINYKNIKHILLTLNNKIKPDILYKNYESIQSIQYLNSYINSNINKYIKNVFCQLKDIQKDSVEDIINLLNNEILEDELVKIILQKEEKLIDNINKVNDVRWNKLLELDKIKVSSDNINTYYNKNGLDKYLIEYFNKENVINNVIKLKDKDNKYIQLNNKLIENIMFENSICIDSYKKIVSNIEKTISEEDILHLNEDKIIYLIENNKFKFNLNLYNKIRQCNENIFILFTRKYIRNIQSMNFKTINYSFEEICKLINSDYISSSLKEKAIKMIKEEDIENIDQDIANSIYNFILKYDVRNKLNTKLIFKLLDLNNNIDEKVKLVYLNLYKIEKENIEEILKKLGENYYRLIKDRTKPSFKLTQENIQIIERLKKIGYNIVFEIEGNAIKVKGTKRNIKNVV